MLVKEFGWVLWSESSISAMYRLMGYVKVVLLWVSSVIPTMFGLFYIMLHTFYNLVFIINPWNCIALGIIGLGCAGDKILMSSIYSWGMDQPYVWVDGCFCFNQVYIAYILSFVGDRKSHVLVVCSPQGVLYLYSIGQGSYSLLHMVRRLMENMEVIYLAIRRVFLNSITFSRGVIGLEMFKWWP